MKIVNIGIVGLNFGVNMIKQLQTEENKKLFKIKAVCATTPEKAEKYAQDLGVKAYIKLEQLLEDPEIDAVGLFTGPKGRAELIRKIIRAGKEIMTTKPFELDADEALKVLTEAKALGRIIHLNSPSPLPPPDIFKIQQWIEDYSLGRPIAARGDYWLSYREKADGTWFDDPEKCPVAPIMRLGIYVINDLVRLFGQAESVSVMQSRIFTERPTPDNAQLNIKFKNGVLANVFASFCINDGQKRGNSMTLNYENGTVYHNVGLLEDCPQENRVDLALITPKGNRNVNSDRNSIFVKGEGYNITKDFAIGKSGDYQWEVFHRAVNGEVLKEECSIDEIVEGIKIIIAMARSEKLGRTEHII